MNAPHSHSPTLTHAVSESQGHLIKPLWSSCCSDEKGGVKKLSGDPRSHSSDNDVAKPEELESGYKSELFCLSRWAQLFGLIIFVIIALRNN